MMTAKVVGETDDQKLVIGSDDAATDWHSGTVVLYRHLVSGQGVLSSLVSRSVAPTAERRRRRFVR